MQAAIEYLRTLPWFLEKKPIVLLLKSCDIKSKQSVINKLNDTLSIYNIEINPFLVVPVSHVADKFQLFV